MAEDQPMSRQTTRKRRTRFARLYQDGSMGVSPAADDFVTARADLIGSSDDDVELLEVEVNVIRSYGKPKLKTVHERSVTCPTCGEEIYIEQEVDNQHDR